MLDLRGCSQLALLQLGKVRWMECFNLLYTERSRERSPAHVISGIGLSQYV